MYKKGHAAIRADPSPAKKGEKKTFKGKRLVNIIRELCVYSLWLFCMIFLLFSP